MLVQVAGFILASLLAPVVNAAPGLELAQLSQRQRPQSITTLSSSQISSFKPLHYPAAQRIATQVRQSTGLVVPIVLQTRTLSQWHQEAMVALCSSPDTDLLLESLDPTLFPGVSPSIHAHSGFTNEQAKTATKILSAVKSAIATHGATKVTIVGHALGAAIALLDGVYLPLHISGVSFKIIGYGMPRVGNHAFADYIDAHLSLTHQ
ncbi:hypothetical protein BYT27DRAFT_7263486 [Phlegmacium glaucopus]|nr:hypothetical protein BYT27DRAFT_7263486 [Phlegmacium glaucopus]